MTTDTSNKTINSVDNLVPSHNTAHSIDNFISSNNTAHSLDNFLSSNNARLDQQLKFIAEADKMTSIIRRTYHVDNSGLENDAEHSWHLALMAMLLGEYAEGKPDCNRAIRMVVVHDLIEIYAGDTYAYDTKGYESKTDREKAAADKLFAQLPDDQNKEIRSLWEEFDAVETDDAKFANCMDRIQPFLHNTLTLGRAWIEHGVKKDDVLGHQKIVEQYMPRIWPWIVENVNNAVIKGWLKP